MIYWFKERNDQTGVKPNFFYRVYGAEQSDCLRDQDGYRSEMGSFPAGAEDARKDEEGEPIPV